MTFMTGLPIMVVALLVIALAYRFYGAFLAAKVLAFDPNRVTPSHRLKDGQNYHPTNKWVLFGHHFAAIAGAGPLIGPVLAAQFGFMPGFIWLLAGSVLAGGVHDLVILFASVRREGMSIAEIAKKEISPFSGVITSIAVFFIIIIALAGLGMVVVNALAESSWATFTIAMTIPIALFMGWYMEIYRKGDLKTASIIGVVLMLLAVVAGKWVPGSFCADWFTFSRHGITFWMAVYGFVASILPVWMLLAPRDYLSSYMKIGTIGLLAVGVILVNPTLKMPMLQYASGGPIIKGPLFPFLFITIACGAISGFHSLIATGTTPKMVNNESELKFIGYGAMLVEGLVSITALIAACALFPGDYFAINTPVEVFNTLGMTMQNLPDLARQIGEQLQGRTGGGVSLAVGMAQIFSGLPGMNGLMSYWYHFVIMFEALFILTTVDAGTRVGRFLLEEFFEMARPGNKKLVWRNNVTNPDRPDRRASSIIASAIVVALWAYFIWTGSISTIWPMFGIANQLLACAALAIGTTVLVNMGRTRYTWTTLVPLVFISVTTLTAGVESIQNIFLPLSRVAGKEFQGTLNVILTVIMMICVVLVIGDAVKHWVKVWGQSRARSAI